MVLKRATEKLAEQSLTYKSNVGDSGSVQC